MSWRDFIEIVAFLGSIFGLAAGFLTWRAAVLNDGRNTRDQPFKQYELNRYGGSFLDIRNISSLFLKLAATFLIIGSAGVFFLVVINAMRPTPPDMVWDYQKLFSWHFLNLWWLFAAALLSVILALIFKLWGK